jgi:hypothetical protein
MDEKADFGGLMHQQRVFMAGRVIFPRRSDNLPARLARRGSNFFRCRGFGGNHLAPFHRRDKRGRDLTMKNKRRAIFVLLFLGSLLALAGAWNLPEDA